MNNLQKLQVKFTNVQMTMEEIAELVSNLVKENEELKAKIKKLEEDSKE
jgi:uncharacterized protein YoxC